jgi:hypothetical protein
MLGLPAPGPGDAGPRPNIARMTFLAPSSRELLVDWESQAWDIAAYLRLAVPAHPDDEELRAVR